MFQYAIFLLEALAHHHIIRAQRKDPDVAHDDRQWHALYAAIWGLVLIFMAYASGDWIYLVTGCCIRLYTHQVVLNHLRGLPSDHLGTGPVDRWTALLFPGKWALYVKTALFILSMLYPFMKTHTL